MCSCVDGICFTRLSYLFKNLWTAQSKILLLAHSYMHTCILHFDTICITCPCNKTTLPWEMSIAQCRMCAGPTSHALTTCIPSLCPAGHETFQTSEELQNPGLLTSTCHTMLFLFLSTELRFYSCPSKSLWLKPKVEVNIQTWSSEGFFKISHCLKT